MIWFVLASMAVMAMYVAAVILREGVPYSVSATYYKLEHPGWFSGCIAASAVLVLPPVFGGRRSRLVVPWPYRGSWDAIRGVRPELQGGAGG